jgi:hypothetical protein
MPVFFFRSLFVEDEIMIVFGTPSDVNVDAKILTRIPNYNGIPVRKSDNFS